MASQRENKDVAFVLVGAELETAVLRTCPALFRLYCTQVFNQVKLICVCDQSCVKDIFFDNLEENLGAGDQEGFLKRCVYLSGDFRSKEVAEVIKDNLAGFSQVVVYFIPPLILKQGDTDELTRVLRPHTETHNGWLRCVIEKPLGLNHSSVMSLAEGLRNSFGGEENVFRLDHFLGKEMVQNITAIRFANRFLEPSWNNANINAVVISCREAKTVRPKEYGSYFDRYGIIREIMADHLLHILALVAMETPVSLEDGESLRDEVAKVLRCVQPAKLEDTVLGQYAGYCDTDGVEDGSLTPTFAVCVLYINNPRWFGVPFILKAGKGMYERRTDIRVQFKPPHNTLFPPSRGGGPLNELVIRVQPHRDIYMKMMRKVPGTKFSVAPTRLDLLGDGASMIDMVGLTPDVSDTSFQRDYDDFLSDTNLDPRTRQYVPVNSYAPDSYERLIYDIIHGDRSSFTREDELSALWSIFTPLLQKLEEDKAFTKLHMETYKIGSKGPASAYKLMEGKGFFGYKLGSEMLGAKHETMMQKLSRQFNLSAFQMEEIVSAFRSEFQRGLEGHPEATIKMLPSFVTNVPNGTERGIFYALDLGGTNFRVSRFIFDGKGGVQLSDERKYTVPDDRMTGSAEELFDFLADCVGCLNLPEDQGKRFYGFTFSFPVLQTALNCGTLIKWTKGFTTEGVVGENVVALLEEALKRKSFDGKVLALANDTVGTLISSAYNDPSTMIGVILGTGTNAAYREYTENITKLPEDIRRLGGEMVINTEWGNFGSNGAQLPATEVDLELDRKSRNAGEQSFEKMISGMYLGEITRLCLQKLHENGELWASKETTVPKSIDEAYTFESRFLSEVEYDLSENLSIVARVENNFGVLQSTIEDRVKVKEVCGMVVQRAAKLTACAIAATIRQIGPERGNGCTVGIDGSVYQHHPSFRMRLSHALGELACQCKIVLAKDGSGRGSALVACGAALQ